MARASRALAIGWGAVAGPPAYRVAARARAAVEPQRPGPTLVAPARAWGASTPPLVAPAWRFALRETGAVR